MFSKTRILGAVAACLLPVAGVAQSRFAADLDGAQVSPPQSHAEIGAGRFWLDRTTGRLHYELRSSVPVVSAAIYDAAPFGPLRSKLLDLTKSGADGFQGATPGPLTQRQFALIASGASQVQIVAQNNVLIRGQVVIGANDFGAVLNGASISPPTNSTATGQLEFDLLNGALLINVGTRSRDNLPSVTERAVHAPNFPTVPKFTVQDGNSVTSLSAFQQSALESEVLETRFKTPAFPNGEIGGPILPTSVTFGRTCPNAPFQPKLKARGAPWSGGELRIKVTGGEPNGAGILAVGFSRRTVVNVVNSCPVYVVPAFLLPLQLDASGSGCFTLRGLPQISDNVVVQFGGAVNGRLYTSNAVEVLFDVSEL